MKIIFHIPFEVNQNNPSGTNIRPVKMFQAMINSGHEVEKIWGRAKERKQKIKELKKRIQSGEKFDLLYSESSTTPTLLTESHHLPTYPFLDFSFFSFCKSHHIKIGLFYRDIHWNFEQYTLKGIKRRYARFFYHYDLSKYNDLIDVLFLPSLEMREYIPSLTSKMKVVELPPGIDSSIDEFAEKRLEHHINMIYVGGVNDLYQIEEVMKSVHQVGNFQLTICTRKNEWELNSINYQKWIGENNNINIIHLSGVELENEMSGQHIASLLIKPTTYWKFVMPLKLFYYLSHFMPIIASKNTKAASFIEQYNIGWIVENNQTEITKLLNHIHQNQHEIKEKIENIKKIRHLHTWESRVEMVINQLKIK
jgi:hypothetical protein